MRYSRWRWACGKSTAGHCAVLPLLLLYVGCQDIRQRVGSTVKKGLRRWHSAARLASPTDAFSLVHWVEHERAVQVVLVHVELSW